MDSHSVKGSEYVLNTVVPAFFVSIYNGMKHVALTKGRIQLLLEHDLGRTASVHQRRKSTAAFHC